ncbi:DUF2262 domain-containing protein [Brachyspira hampsonii]|uniref:Uncharacterized protein n=1 Tax=Brachyspira hampsonii 30446 TaxID=1289135 RepID=A0A2U4FPI7_9SPIR|nr:DUF2262 domain-containing protein [Brachyspira hampsonii]EKV57053.1 hypothetical protein A966_08439 [Brachyspira hampsonii 30446]MBW5390530.1 DUF2262 domain-containing protein [Brachyspira hampsonii]MBW5393978.1 DUF2262 domain-containing protein [Brachyspira hampsonii]OEJ19268.1 hypothetical protein A9495_04890 [Brachyspira hampsonii]
MFYLQKESEFLDEYKDVAFIIGSPEFFGARAEDDDKINVLMMCIAYKDIETGYIEKNKKIVVRMKIDEKELDYYKKIIKRESVVKLKVRYEKEQGEELAEFLLADIIDNNYKDEDLNKMLRDYLKPIYYSDEVLGSFLYNRMVGSFDKEIEWLNNKKVLMAFDDSTESDKNKAVNFLRDIFLDKEEFDKKIKEYSARKIIREGNNISSKNGGNTIDEEVFIKEFMSKIDFLEIIVHEKDDYVNYRLGNKKVFKMDIIAEGNLSGNLFNAFISPF